MKTLLFHSMLWLCSILCLQNSNAQIPNGNYYVENQTSGLYVGIVGASTAAGAQALLWTNDGQRDIVWEFTRNYDGSYNIKNTNSNRYLSIENGRSHNGALVLQDNTTPTQSWNLISLGRIGVKIQNRATGLYLAVMGGDVRRERQLIGWSDDNQPDIRWALREVMTAPPTTPNPPPPAPRPQEVVSVYLHSFYCHGVDDGRFGSRDGEELFGYLRCGVSTNSRPITDYSSGVPANNGSTLLFLRNSNQVVQLKSGEEHIIKETRTFTLNADEVANARIFINGDLDELDGDGLSDDISSFVNRTPIGIITPLDALAKIFHRDGNDKLEKFKADERMFIPLTSIAKGQSRNIEQRFASGGTNVIAYWSIMRH